MGAWAAPEDHKACGTITVHCSPDVTAQTHTRPEDSWL